MTLTSLETLTIIGMVALGTQITRFLPFLLFARREQTHPFVAYLGRVLPYAAIGLLVVYCLKNVSLTAAPHGLPEALAILCVAALHLWKNNTLLSIGGGTIIYMLLVQTLFA